MIILWSHRYFTRMWCCYELATYLRHPEAVRPLTLFAVDMSVVTLGFLICSFPCPLQGKQAGLTINNQINK